MKLICRICGSTKLGLLTLSLIVLSSVRRATVDFAIEEFDRWHTLIEIPQESKSRPVGAKDATSTSLDPYEKENRPRKKPSNHLKIDSNSPPVKLMLLRAIGNPLPPRHHPEQAYNNLKFTLEHELDFPHLTKWWVLNRLVNQTLQQQLESLLQAHSQEYFVIPFEITEYAKLRYRFDYYPQIMPIDEESLDLKQAPLHNKVWYVTNQNGARNAMIDFGQAFWPRHEWILPWDGNCFLHSNAYNAIYRHLKNMPSNQKYAVTYMNRVAENIEVLQESYNPRRTEEPQVIFRRTALGRFHPLLSYGRFNKVEFLQRLMLSGAWDSSRPPMVWEFQHLGPFHLPIPDLHNITADGPVKSIGYVTRLSSGHPLLEKTNALRKQARNQAMPLLISQLDKRVAVGMYGFRPGQLLFYHEDALERNRQLYRQADTTLIRIVSELRQKAMEAVASGPWSVMDKPDYSVAESGDKHDFYQLAPFYWPPNPELANDTHNKWRTISGRQYPPTQIHGPGSEEFDRTRLQEMQYNTTILGLAFFMTGEKKFAEIAARNVRTWFLDKETRMNPNLMYAQVRKGYNNNTGIPSGIIEFKDVYFMLDAIRIIEKGGFLTHKEKVELRAWFRKYLFWLENSVSGMTEANSGNNHEAYYGIQVVAVSAFVDDTSKMIWYAERAGLQLRKQIAHDGSMPRELRRPTCEHDQFFALHGWAVLSRLTETVQRNLWQNQMSESNSNKTKELSPLCRAAQYALSFFGRRSKCTHSFDIEETGVRWWPLLHESLRHCPLLGQEDQLWPIPWFSSDAPRPPESTYEMPCLFDPNDGIAPFWNLGLTHEQR